MSRNVFCSEGDLPETCLLPPHVSIMIDGFTRESCFVNVSILSVSPHVFDKRVFPNLCLCIMLNGLNFTEANTHVDRIFCIK